MEEKISYYVSTLDKIKQKVSDPQISVAILKEIAKDRRMEKIQSERSKDTSGDIPATKKQIGFLRDLGIEIQPGLTKKQASDLISGARGK